MPEESISGVATGPFPMLKNVLSKWIEVQDQLYYELSPNNAPWWYNERASIGSLAAAVWLCEGIAFEEYMTDKNVRDGCDKEELVGGRGDIFFRVCQTGFRAEAKQAWGKLRGYSQRSYIDKNLTNALEEARRRPVEKREHRIGILFLSPNIPEKFGDEIDEKIADWVKILQNTRDAACAWTFPAAARKHLSEDEHKIYPGCAILIKAMR